MDRSKTTLPSDQEKRSTAMKEASVGAPALARRVSRLALSQAPGPRLIGPAPGPRLIGPAPGPRLISQAPGPRLIGPAPGPRLISQAPGPRLIGPAPGPRLISLKGLLTAHRFSKGLRERAALKHAARKAPVRKPTVIIHEQIPSSSARPAERFPCAAVSRLLRDFLSTRLDGLRYSAPCGGALVKELSEEVRGLVRTLCPPRYRLVCLASLGQQGGGGLLASRCLWDQHTDACVSHTYRTHDMFCTIDVFAVYYE